VYRYSGNSMSEEREVDNDDEVSKPSKGAVIERKAKR
jgi:hypothetical protein